MSFYVLVNPKIEFFRKALFSYQVAEKHLPVEFSDLIYNKGTLLFYLQDYVKSVEEFKRADKLDKTLEADIKAKECETIIHRIKKDFFDRFFSSSFIKDIIKELNSYISLRENSLKVAISKYKNENNSNWKLTSFTKLTEKANKRIFVIGKPLKWIQTQNLISKMLLLIDFNENYIILSIFNAPETIINKIFLKKSILSIIDPWFKLTKTFEKGEREYIPFIQIFDFNDIIIDNSRVKKNK